MGQLTVEQRSVGEVGVVRAQGTIDAATSGVMETSLRDLLRGGTKKLVVSLKDVSFMSSAGWGLLLGILKEVRAQGGAMAVSAMSAEIRHVYQLLGIKAFMKEFPSEDEAVAALR